MAANIFNIEGERIDSLAEFLRREKDATWCNLLYYPEVFESETRHPLVFNENKFIEISFKDTDLKNIKFVRCKFERCLFIGASITECEFIDCTFIDTNTSKLIIQSCLFDPTCFDKNFNLIDDTNIAIDLYQALYKNASQEHQPTHAVESLYKMRLAETSQLASKKKRGVINSKTYYKQKIINLIYDFVSGYGLRSGRVFRLLAIVITVFSASNYCLKNYIFSNPESFTFIDSVYFTCITITTLGYGDITPATGFGKMFITFQVLFGFIVISIFLAAVAKKALKEI